MICISMSQFSKLLYLFFLISLLLLIPAGILAQIPKDNIDPLTPFNFVLLEEITTGGKIIKIPPGISAIVDKDSRLIIRFKKDLLEKGIKREELIEKWTQFLKSEKYKELERKLMEAKCDAFRNQVQKLINLRIEQMFLEAGGYDISISARVLQKQGRPFDLTVNGYTTVKEHVLSEEKRIPSEIKSKDSRDKTEEIRRVVTTVDRRLYRSYVPPYLPVKPENLDIEDEIFDTFINLREEDFVDGDILNVTVANHHGKHPRRITWELEIQDVGIQTKQDPTLLLIKRFKNPGTDLDQESNFKPAPGSSFLFKFTTRNRLLNFIDPSIGINVSFLDFRSDKDLEIGVGSVLSFFNGIFQINFGWNLNVESDRGYWSIGIGFLDIAGKIKELVKK